MASRYLDEEDEEGAGASYLEQQASASIPEPDAIAWNSKADPQDRSQGQGLSMDASFQGFKNSPSTMDGSFQGFKTTPQVPLVRPVTVNPVMVGPAMAQNNDMYSNWLNKRRKNR